MSKTKILPVILCGGTGSRLWPLSRSTFPKQYLEIGSHDNITFLQNTINRFKNNENFEDPLFICNEEHRFIVAEQIRAINISASSILLEPVGRNTAPAITVASLKAIEIFDDPMLLILPSDHLIKDEKNFLKVVDEAFNYANNGKIVTFGITPDKPETGYGYIESKNDLDFNKLNGELIVSFIEKPNLEKASQLITKKNFSWNSGIFLFKADILIKEIKIKQPKILSLCKESLEGNNFDLDFQRLNKKKFSKCKNISIDKAIMENTNLGVVLPLKAGWSDIGSWQSMWEVGAKDNMQNVICGDVLVEDVKNSYIRTDNRLIVGIGFEDLVIIDTDDALLVAQKGTTQNVKNIVKYLESNNKSQANIHKTIFRPWGSYSSISKGKNWQVKKIIVKPNQSLSLQMHKFRTEHWIIVSGEAKVQINNKEKTLIKNESTYIPANTKHRLSNISEEDLILIEIQSGSYLGEDDILRFEDNYGRI
tara:strand:- start:179 stop:1615 length:1437 start_codon:yes stop_codon:yes gene_type:complete